MHPISSGSVSKDHRSFYQEPYQLLVRLFKEQCEVIDKSDPGKGRGNKIKIKRKSKGQTLQSAYGPKASYGHKGQGYSAYITETGNNKGKCEIITERHLVLRNQN
jgi:hypothetical protein